MTAEAAANHLVQFTTGNYVKRAYIIAIHNILHIDLRYVIGNIVTKNMSITRINL